MKVIRPGVEIHIPPMPDKPEEIYRFIERIGRTCYKSEEKITDESHVAFIERLRNAGHWAMLEHYIFILEVTQRMYDDMFNEIKSFSSLDANFSNYIGFLKFSTMNESYEFDKRRCFVSMSSTAISNLWKCPIVLQFADSAFAYLCSWIKEKYPLLIKEPEGAYENISPARMRHLEPNSNIPEGIKTITVDELASLVHDKATYDSYMLHASMTVKFICDRGVTHELVRHRPASFAQESTRYCNYANGKYGNEITVIEPCFFEEGSSKYEQWYLGCTEAEAAYSELMRMSCKPQEARSVLPNSLKTEIWMTARLCEWDHMLGLRCDKAAHPQMRELCIPLAKSLSDLESVLLGIPVNLGGHEE